MKKKKNVVMAVAILVAILALGIGYALSSQTLTVNGTATAKTTDEFKVRFDGTTSATPDGKATATAAAESEEGTCTIVLEKVNDTATCTFQFKNYSPAGIQAKVQPTNIKIYNEGGTVAYADDYIGLEITESFAADTILDPNDTEDFTITATLNKAYVGDNDHEKKFVVKLEGIEAVQA